MRWMPNGSGHRGRIGVLTPHLDAVPETEYQQLAPEGVSIHAARVPLGMKIGNDGTVVPYVGEDIALDFAENAALDQAARLLAALNPSAVIYAFTSSSYILKRAGDARLRTRLEESTGGAPVVLQAPALADALGALGVARVSLVHPPWFSRELDRLGVDYYADFGIDAVAHGPVIPRDNYGDMTSEQVYDWVVEKTPDTAEAVVIAGGGFRAIGAISALEKALDRPVLTANQTAFWRALRLSGVKDNLQGYGRLFGNLAGDEANRS